ncbi:MAG: SMP-30/gluconolactonase/LRE family protein [Roseovarius sp.]|nr:SMP-30/gluconolactonase/LRE family protein [Roseovarius sp.]
MNISKIHSCIRCDLGEGPLWDPVRNALFWFDINRHRLHCDAGDGSGYAQFDEFASAAGRTAGKELLVATETALVLFDPDKEASEVICPLEADNPKNRSNDGRADPYGGFWIGTMGKKMETGAGAIYRYWRGELRKLYSPITIPNATCFSPDGAYAYFTDTAREIIWRQRLDDDGWPRGDAETFLDFPPNQYHPDGSVVDTNGNLWCTQYGYGVVTVFSPDGTETRRIPVPARQPTCTAFGGPDMSTLFVTSAYQNMENPGPDDGKTYRIETDATGQTEHVVTL